MAISYLQQKMSSLSGTGRRGGRGAYGSNRGAALAAARLKAAALRLSLYVFFADFLH